jgi:hypothetical protein
VDQGEDDVLEHRAVRDPAAVAAERMAEDECLTRRQERRELVPQRFEQAGWNGRHGSSV